MVTPRGVNPLVARFLGYHKHLLPLRGFKTIREPDIKAVGVVDTQSVDRLGPAAPWIKAAEHVTVVDHHVGVSGDIEADEVIIEHVGSATTVIVERLRALVDSPPEANKPRLMLTETEATLFALGIRADTGQLSFPATTPRDAYALAWLMEQGCSQSAIAEFGQARLSAHQRDLLSKAMSSMRLSTIEGLKLSSVVLDTGRGFVTGMASVCEELLQLLACDVIILGVLHQNAKSQSFLSLIGRASPRAEARAINLNEVMGNWQGGGHRAAAAASIKLEKPKNVHEVDAVRDGSSGVGSADRSGSGSSGDDDGSSSSKGATNTGRVSPDGESGDSTRSGEEDTQTGAEAGWEVASAERILEEAMTLVPEPKVESKHRVHLTPCLLQVLPHQPSPTLTHPIQPPPALTPGAGPDPRADVRF